MKKKQKTKVVGILLGVILCLVCVAAFVVGKSDNKENENTNNNTNEITPYVYADDVVGYKISTSYGDVAFPEKWKDIVETELITTDEKEVLEFRVALEGKEEIHVFDLVFSKDDFELGQIVISEEEKIAVSIESYVYDLDETYTDEDKLTISSVEFDINYLIQSLENIENFEKW